VRELRSIKRQYEAVGIGEREEEPLLLSRVCGVVQEECG
jgi:hypothetical protein